MCDGCLNAKPKDHRDDNDIPSPEAENLDIREEAAAVHVLLRTRARAP
eukprot:CAMPEP_0195107272 /NCGR_PEP_ID=MMETSP0448-20130528/81987_1 /TAXON_ID=66468 /ORGANISM="Heterocapsa triquestra, Strain CCMP 448" /LENGTH=47 /DNA_ID= /DNA_START= /DNA_END= /DNA_ORIENTATION=